MAKRNRLIRAHFWCFIFFLNLNIISGQSLDDLNIVTTILPDLDVIYSNQFNKTTTPTSTTAIPDLNVDESSHFKDGQCKNDTHCEQPNQFCKLDNQTEFGECACSRGFIGDDCNQITDCSMCINRSKCIKSSNGTQSCSCRNGYYGTTCEKTHCGVCVHGICVHDELNDQYECFCMNGFTGHGCTEDFNDCLGNTKCQNNGTCVDRVAGFICNCPQGFTGKFCEKDINECELNPCRNGNCLNTLGGYTCECEVGFKGINCEENIDDCASNPCLHGKCIDKINAYECDCEGTGWNGTNCEKNINDCESNPCLNGAVCEDLIKDFQCHCLKGFKGKRCEEEIFECDSKPCRNGGICFEKSNSTLIDEINASNNGSLNETIDSESYYCKCAPGFKGLNCEINIDDCLDVNCNNGTCIDLVDSYKCQCLRGYSGKHCEQDINMCELNNPCKNHGKCIDSAGSDFYCDCSNTGYTGADCSENINECEENPCLHNATCIDLKPYYECRCHLGYKGQHCEEDIAECNPKSNPCHNNGICYERSDKKLYGFHNKNLPFYGQEFNYANASGYICKCPAGIMGINCDFNINECQNVNCHNGTCKDGINEYTCLCYPGFEGDHCELEINECQNQPCLHSGVCKDLINDFECTCPMYTSGKQCEHVFRGCETNLCLNNGTCLQHPIIKSTFTCECAENYTGEYCQMKLSKDFDLFLLVLISCGCLVIIVFLIGIFICIKRVKKARATRGTYSPSTQEMFGNSAGEILKPPPEERLI